MLCLGFSTSTDKSSVAVGQDGKILGKSSWTRATHGSEGLTFKIEELFRKHKIKLKDLELIAVDKGPGSFTGARVGVNVAKTLAYSLGIPIFAPTSLEILAYQYSLIARKFPTTVFTLLDAHRSLFYFGKFEVVSRGNFKVFEISKALPVEQIAERVKSNIQFLGNLSSDQWNDVSKAIKTRHDHDKVKLTFPNKALQSPAAQALVHYPLNGYPYLMTRWDLLEPTYVRVPDVILRLQKI